MRLFWKIFIAVFISFIITFILIAYVTSATQMFYAENHMLRENRIIGNFMAKEIEVGQLEQWPLENLEKLSKREDFLFWWVVRDDGTIHLADNASFMGTNAYDYFPQIPDTKEDIFLDYKQNYGIFFKPLKEGGWSFWFGFSLKEISMLAGNIIFLALVVFISSVGMLGVILYFAITYLTQPVQKLLNGTKAVAEGKLDYRLHIKSGDELGQLASAFNNMVNDVKESRKKLETYSKTLERKVRLRTRELAKKVDQLTKAKAATLNMMDDVADANQKLRSKQREIKKTNRKLLETTEKLRRLNRRMKELDVLKTEFLNIGAHELKTPLIPIIGYLDLLQRDKSLGAMQKKEIDICLRNARRLQLLVNDILDISKLESRAMKFNMKKLDLRDVIRNTVADFRESAKKKNIMFVEKTSAEPLFVMGDAYRITQVLENLVNNALKFTDSGSVTIDALKEDSNVMVKVSDTGIGIAKKDMPKIFTKFFQADASVKRKYSGTGLGLAISKSIIMEHEGTIWAKSVLGKGSTFIFTLPLIKSKRGHIMSKQNQNV